MAQMLSVLPLTILPSVIVLLDIEVIQQSSAKVNNIFFKIGSSFNFIFIVQKFFLNVDPMKNVVSNEFV